MEVKDWIMFAAIIGTAILAIASCKIAVSNLLLLRKVNKKEVTNGA